MKLATENENMVFVKMIKRENSKFREYQMNVGALWRICQNLIIFFYYKVVSVC